MYLFSNDLPLSEGRSQCAEGALRERYNARRRALSIYFMHYNFVRIHQTLRVTPAMAAGVTDTLWSLDDMVRIVDEWEAHQKDEKTV